MSTTYPLLARGVPSLVTGLNRLITRLLRTGLPLGPNVLLTVHGRKTGRPYTFPIALLELDGRRYVQGAFGETSWVRNLRAVPGASIAKGRWHQDVDARELPPEEAASVLRDALAPFISHWYTAPLVGVFFGFSRSPSDADFLEAAHSHPVFELRPSHH